MKLDSKIFDSIRVSGKRNSPKRADSVSSNSYLCVSFAVTTLAFTLASGYAFSAEWSAEPSVTLRQDYNDNINLTSAPHKPVWGTILSPAITLSV